MRTPNYILLQPYGGVPAGTFVRPIELQWISQDVLDHYKITKHLVDEKKEVVCYCSYGMIKIPRNLIDEV